MDPLEREHWRNRIALRMGSFQEGSRQVTCVSAHFYDSTPHRCELCYTDHGHEVFVIKNRSGKKLSAEISCLKEMIRFRVVEVEELERWLPKMGELKLEVENRRQEAERLRQEERVRLERKVIVRKRTPQEPV